MEHKKFNLFIFIILVLPLLFGNSVFAMTQAQLNSILNNTEFYDPPNNCSNTSSSGGTEDTSPCSCGLTSTPGTSIGGTVSTTASQEQVIKIIIGVAKYEDLGQEGALIGLMVAEDESGMQIDANSNVPLSETVPHNQTGSNNESLGIFQQQPQDGWSTIATGPAALQNLAAITQLMNPAYDTEAFFGTPAGTNLTGLAVPTALNKGLQNTPNWQNLSPEVAGQLVQNHNATGIGRSNYLNHLQNSLPQARAFLNQYWSSSPPVAPPIAFSGGRPPSSVNGTCGISITCNNSSLSATSTPITGDQTSLRQQVVCLAEQQLAIWKSQPGYPWNRANTYSQSGYLTYSQGNTQQWCADFVSWIYEQVGYPLQPDPNWRISWVPDIQTIGEQNQNFQWHPESSGYTPQPGDLAIYSGDGHVNIFISNENGTSTYIGGDQGVGPYPGGSIVSEQPWPGYYDNGGILGYVSPN